MKKFHLGNIYSVQQMFNGLVIKKLTLFCLVHLNQKKWSPLLGVHLLDIHFWLVTSSRESMGQIYRLSFWDKQWKIILYVYQYT